jgi:hemin uptake protein HemP
MNRRSQPMTSDDEKEAESTPPGPAGDPGRPFTVTSEQLLQGRRELWIEHEGEIYRLRVTSRGKLYLTK